MKWLEEILTSEEIEDKVEAVKKELPKHFIPKDKFNEQADKLKEKEEELNTTNEKMDELSSQVQNLSKSEEEKEKLKEQINNLNTEFETFKNEAENRVTNIKKKQAVERGLREANANPDTIDLLIEKFDLEQVELDDNETVKNFDKHLEPIKEQRKSLFGETQVTGDKPSTGDTPPGNNYKAMYEQAIKEGKTREAIRIKQEAFQKGENF